MRLAARRALAFRPGHFASERRGARPKNCGSFSERGSGRQPLDKERQKWRHHLHRAAVWRSRPVSVALAVSDQAIFVGSNAAAIKAAVTRGAPPDGALEKSEIFRDISKQVPAPTSAFDYVDTRLLFERADAAVRPCF